MTDRTDFIERLVKQKPDQYLTTITVRIDDEIIHIGLFKCEICNKPIADSQYNFARCCGSCDTGQDNPEWIIEKPDDSNGLTFTGNLDKLQFKNLQ